MQKKLDWIPRSPNDLSGRDIIFYICLSILVLAAVKYIASLLCDYIEVILVFALMLSTSMATFIILTAFGDMFHHKQVKRAAYATESLIQAKVIDIKGAKILVLANEPCPEPIYECRDKRHEWTGRLKLGDSVSIKKISRYDAADREIDWWYDGITMALES